MSELASSVWGRIVGKLGILHGVSCVTSSTKKVFFCIISISLGVKVIGFSKTMPNLSSPLSTTKNVFLNLLNRFYTHNPQQLLLKRLERF